MGRSYCLLFRREDTQEDGRVGAWSFDLVLEKAAVGDQFVHEGSCLIDAEFEAAIGLVDEGVLGDERILRDEFKDVAQFRWEAPDALTAGKHTIEFDFTYEGPGIAKGGTGVLKVDGKDVATRTIPKTIPFLLPADETFDVGVDTRTGVNDQDYQVPFRFTGKLDKLTFKLGPEQLTAADRKVIGTAVARARD